METNARGADVFIVDDDTSVSFSVQACIETLFNREHTNFLTFQRVCEAHAVYAGGRRKHGIALALIICDNSTPGEMSGVDFRSVIRQSGDAETPFILLTGESREECAGGISDEFFRYLGKPFDVRDLRNYVHELAPRYMRHVM